MNSDKSISVNIELFIPLISEAVANGRSVTLKGTGDSMYPFINQETDTVCLSPLPDRAPKRGDIYLYKRESGRYAIHRVYKVCRDASLVMLGDNQLFLEKNIKPSDLLAFVPNIIRDGETVSCQDGKRHKAALQRMRRRVFRFRIKMFMRGFFENL